MCGPVIKRKVGGRQVASLQICFGIFSWLYVSEPEARNLLWSNAMAAKLSLMWRMLVHSLAMFRGHDVD